MLSIYDLYDLSAVYKIVRANPKYEKNSVVLETVLLAMEKNISEYSFNRFRTMLSQIENLDNEKYKFAFVENVYTYFPSFITDKAICNALTYSTEALLILIKEQRIEQAIALSDCLHNLPILIAENNFKIPKEFIRNELSYYKRNWDKSFSLSKYRKE